MLKSKSELDSFLSSVINKKSFDPIIEPVVDYVFETHNVPKGIVSDYMTGRKPMSEADEVLEYCILKGIAECTPKTQKAKEESSKRIAEYYTAIEQKKYDKWKRASNSFKWPITIPCFEVSDDQWIGYSHMSFLMQLRAAQLIRYNENAQRVMKRKLNGSQEEYVIALNKKAVREIRQSYEEGTYIPNTITLNIPEDLDSSYKYNEDTHELIINSLESFDITDGYHRYIAACEIYDNDEKFDTPIELRITRFSDEKARGFIYQEDQKTKMTKVESESMNVNAPANIITERLNSSSTSNFKGLIKRTGGIIDFANLSICIANHYLKDKPTIGRPELISIYKEIEEFLNLLSDNDTSLLTEKWNFNYILSSILVASYINKKKQDIKKVDLNKVVKSLAEELDYTPSKKFTNKDMEELNGKIAKQFKSK